MQKYIGVKLIEAEPMALGDYNKFKGWTIPEDEDPAREGYKVKYSDDYISWSPKDVFEKSYLPLADGNGTKITGEDVKNFIKTIDSSKFGEKTSLVKVTLNNGFEIIETSSCVDSSNYDHELGIELSVKKIRNKVYEYLGFLLQSAKGGMK